MTLAAEYVRAIYVGTGTTGPFAVPFRFEVNSHVKVARKASSGTVTTLTEGTHYTLSGGPAAGQVTLATALAAASGLLPAESIEIYRDRPLSQDTAFGVNSSYRSAIHEAALDASRQIDQDLDAKISRALRAPPTEGMSMVLPSKESRAGALLGFNSAGEPIPIDPDTLDAMGDGDPLGVTPISSGGTGATSASEARSNLGIGAVGTLESIGAGDIATAHAATSHATIISSDLSTNSAARLRDIGVWVVESATTTVAPAVTNGHAYLVPSDATGAWAAQVGKIAYGEGGSWTYKTPAKGWVAYARDSDIERYHDGSAWAVTGGVGGDADVVLSDADSRVAGFAIVNQQGGGGKFRVHWTVDQRIVVYGDQAAFSYDPAGDNWGPFEINIPWDTSTIRIEKIYQGINYILVQTDQATGNLWHMGSSAHGQGGNGGTSNVGILARIQKFVDDAVKIDAVYTEAGLSHSDAFWFAKTTGGLLYGCGSSGATHTQGYANTANLSTPRKLTYSDGTTAVTGVVSVSCSTVYAPVWALLSSGKAIRWGAGTSGAHGNNNTTAMQWPDALETAPGSGTDRTDIAQVVTTGSAIANTFATTWILTTAGKIESSGSRYYGNGDGAALTSAAVNTFQPASGAIDGLTVTQIAGGGGEYCLCIAITSTSVAYMAGYQGNAQLGGGATTNLNVFTILSGLPSGFSGALTAARVSGANAYVAAYLEATISGVKTIASIGYDGHYNTARGISGTSAGSQTWGTIQGGKGTISAWQVLGDHQIYGIEVLSTDGELRYAGGNDQGQGGVQFGNLHGVPYLQPCRLSGPRIAKPPTWRGAYSAGVAYTERDVVENEGSSWINVLASTGVAPPTLPTEANSNWELLAAKGDVGEIGSSGPMLLDYTFDTASTADSDPGSGKLRANHATPASVTTFYFDDADRFGTSRAAELATWDDSTSTVKGKLHLVDLTTTTKRWTYNVTAWTSASGYSKLTVAHTSGADAFSAVNVACLFVPKGDKGDDGDPGPQGEPGAGSVTNGDVDEFVGVINLFDAADITDNNYVNSGGGLVSNASYYATGFMRVQPGAEITFSHASVAISGLALHWYDDTQTFDSDYAGTIAANTPITVPSGVKYARASMSKSSAPSGRLMVVHGDTLPSLYLPFGLASTTLLARIGRAQAAATNRDKNRFNDQIHESGKAINSSTGTADSFGSFTATGYLSVPGGSTITLTPAITGFTSPYGGAFYDYNFNYISAAFAGPTTAGQQISTPADAAYLRFTMTNAQAATGGIQVLDGAVGSPGAYNSTTGALLADIRPWAGKVGFWQGDSISAGTDWITPTLTWAGMSLSMNAARSGRKMDKALFRADDTTALVSSDFTSVDLAVLFLGSNDASAGTTIGSISDATSATTFYGYTKKFVEQLLTWKPTIKIMIATPIRYRSAVSDATMKSYADALKEVAAYYSLPILDFFAESGINSLTASTYTSDNVHPNTAGNTAGLIGPLKGRLVSVYPNT